MVVVVLIMLAFSCMQLEPALSFMLLPKSFLHGKTPRAISSVSSVRDFTNFHRTLQMTGSQKPILWFTLVYEDAPILSGNSPSSVNMPAELTTIDGFLRLLRSDNPKSVGICDILELKVYQSESDFKNKQNPLKLAADISEFVKGETYPLYVVLPREYYNPVSKNTRAPQTSSTASNARQVRWNKINNVLDNIGKGRTSASGSDSTPFSTITWNTIGDIFEPYTLPVVLPEKTIPKEDLDVLYKCIISVATCFGYPSLGNEAKRLYFIAPVLVCVCLILKDVLIEVEENMRGNRIKANGKFEFVLRRAGKRICITEAKTGNMWQGRAQALLGCETLADIESLDSVYCVITDFKAWHFVCSKDQVIEIEETTMDFGRGVPTRASLGKIAGKLYSLLS